MNIFYVCWNEDYVRQAFASAVQTARICSDDRVLVYVLGRSFAPTAGMAKAIREHSIEIILLEDYTIPSSPAMLDVPRFDVSKLVDKPCLYLDADAMMVRKHGIANKPSNASIYTFSLSPTNYLNFIDMHAVMFDEFQWSMIPFPSEMFANTMGIYSTVIHTMLRNPPFFRFNLGQILFSRPDDDLVDRFSSRCLQASLLTNVFGAGEAVFTSESCMGRIAHRPYDEPDVFDHLSHIYSSNLDNIVVGEDGLISLFGHTEKVIHVSVPNILIAVMFDDGSIKVKYDASWRAANAKRN